VFVRIVLANRRNQSGAVKRSRNRFCRIGAVALVLLLAVFEVDNSAIVPKAWSDGRGSVSADFSGRDGKVSSARPTQPLSSTANDVDLAATLSFSALGEDRDSTTGWDVAAVHADSTEAQRRSLEEWARTMAASSVIAGVSPLSLAEPGSRLDAYLGQNTSTPVAGSSSADAETATAVLALGSSGSGDTVGFERAFGITPLAGFGGGSTIRDFSALTAGHGPDKSDSNMALPGYMPFGYTLNDMAESSSNAREAAVNANQPEGGNNTLPADMFLPDSVGFDQPYRAGGASAITWEYYLAIHESWYSPGGTVPVTVPEASARTFLIADLAAALAVVLLVRRWVSRRV